VRQVRMVVALGVVALLWALTAPTVDARQRGGKTRKADKTRFFDFDDLLIDGEFRKPATLYTRAMKSPRFDRLLRLQKSFLDQLGHTVRYPSLRWDR